jgi:hypothetical protein
VIRPLLLSLAPCALAACAAVPGFDDPQVAGGAHYAMFRLRGNTALQSGAGGAIVSNPAIDVREFGIEDSEDDVGFQLAVGDGFSELELHYLRFETEGLAPAPMPASWGRIDAGDAIFADAEMTEWRLRYVAGLLDQQIGEELTLRIGAGGLLAHRELDFAATATSGARRHEIRIHDDGVAYAAARGELAFGPAALRADYAYSDDWTFGGDWNGHLDDLEITASYSFAAQDATVFAGFRRALLGARGVEGNLIYDADFVLDGFFVGGRLRF